MANYVKMKELVGKSFTVESVGRYVYKKWDTAKREMLTADSYQEGFRKVYPVTTDKGQLDVSASQLGSMFEGLQQDGKADINNQTFSVKSNGKEGQEIRYFINPVREGSQEAVQRSEMPLEATKTPQTTNTPSEKNKPLEDDSERPPIESYGDIPF